MFDRCYVCGESGHIRTACPRRSRERKNFPPAQGYARPEPWIDPSPPQEPHLYPDDHYLLYVCPWCLAGEMVPCQNRAEKRQAREPHNARMLLCDVG